MLCMSETSEMVFAAFTQHCMQSTDIMSEMSKILCIQWPLTPPGRKARCSRTIRHVGLAVHHHAVRGGSFVNFLGLVKLQGWLQARRTANPQFLNAMGVLSNPVILMKLWQSCILHTLTEPATKNLEFRQLQCLKCEGPVKFLGHWQVQMPT